MNTEKKSDRPKVHTAARKGSVARRGSAQRRSDIHSMQIEMSDSNTHFNSFPKVSDNAFWSSSKERHAFPTGNVSTKGKVYFKKFTQEQVTKSMLFIKDKPKVDLHTPSDAEELNFITITKPDTRKDVTEETNTFKKKIKKIWNKISEKSIQGKMSEEGGDVTVTYMLNSIDVALTNSQEKIKRYEQERMRIDHEVKEMRKDMVNLTKSRDIDFEDDGKSDKIQKNLRLIRGHLHSYKRDVLERWKRDIHQVMVIATPLLNDIITILRSGPLNFSKPKTFEPDKYIQEVSPKFQDILSEIGWIQHCLTENIQSFQKNFVPTDLYMQLEENNRILNQDIVNLNGEKEELLNRLSKIAGANLTDNNPNIADLSDPNRATKLAEQYSELYDTPWTDAFEELGNTDERECIDYLLNILVESYTLCGEISHDQQCWLTATLLCPTRCVTSNSKTELTKTIDDITLSTVQSRSLADLRKQCTEVSVTDVKTFISKRREKWVKNETVEIYTYKCIELCWLMHLQTPPVYLDAHLETNSKFDTNKYKQYTKSGSKVDYLVWPTLLLHKDGPVLCKGVAQGK